MPSVIVSHSLQKKKKENNVVQFENSLYRIRSTFDITKTGVVPIIAEVF